MGTSATTVQMYNNTGGVFNLEPLSGNVGLIDSTGVITPDTKGTCE